MMNRWARNKLLLCVVLVSFSVSACSGTRSASLIQLPERPVSLKPADQKPVWVDGREYLTRQTDELAIAVNYLNQTTETYQDYLFFYVEVSNLSDQPLTVYPVQFSCEADSVDLTFATDPDARISELDGYLAGEPLPKQEKEGMSTGEKVLVGIFFAVVVIALIVVLASGGSDDDHDSKKSKKKKKSKSAKKSSSDKEKTKKPGGVSGAISDKSGVDKESKPAKTSGSGATSNGHGDKSKADGRSGGSSRSGRSSGSSGSGGNFSFWFEGYHYYDDTDDDYAEQVEKVDSKTAQLLTLKNRWSESFIRTTTLEPGETVKGKVAFPISEPPDEVILKLSVEDLTESFVFRAE